MYFNVINKLLNPPSFDAINWENFQKQTLTLNFPSSRTCFLRSLLWVGTSILHPELHSVSCLLNIRYYASFFLKVISFYGQKSFKT